MLILTAVIVVIPTERKYTNHKVTNAMGVPLTSIVSVAMVNMLDVILIFVEQVKYVCQHFNHVCLEIQRFFERAIKVLTTDTTTHATSSATTDATTDATTQAILSATTDVAKDVTTHATTDTTTHAILRTGFETTPGTTSGLLRYIV